MKPAALSPRRILFVKSDTAGDLLLFSPVLEQVQAAWPEAEIGLLIRPQYLDLVPLLPPEVKYLPLPITSKAGSPMEEMEPRLVKETVAAFAPEILVAAVFAKTWIEAAAAAGAPSARRISLGPAQFDPGTDDWLTVHTSVSASELYPEEVPISDSVHELDKNAALVGYLCEIPPPTLAVKLRLPKEALETADQVISGFALAAKGFVLCNPAGGIHVPIKSWPIQSYATVIRTLCARDRTPVVLCALTEEREALDELIRLAGPNDNLHFWLGLPGQFSVMAALATRARLYFGNDTATLHVAEAVGIPVVGIFGGGTWPRFRPRNPASVSIIHPLPCFQCGWDCHLGDAPCVKLITPEDVIPVLEERFGSNSGSAAPTQVVEIAHLTQGWVHFIAQSRQIHNSLKNESTARFAQILELTGLARRQESEIAELNLLAANLRSDLIAVQNHRVLEAAQIKAVGAESSARYAQIQELTGLALRRETEIGELNRIAAKLQKDLSESVQQRAVESAKIKALADENDARYAQILELTELAHRYLADIKFLNRAAAELRSEVSRLNVEADVRNTENSSHRAEFKATLDALQFEFNGLKIEHENCYRQLTEVSAALNLNLSALHALRASKWVRFGAKIRLLPSQPAT